MSYDLNGIDQSTSMSLLVKYLRYILTKREFGVFKGIPRDFTVSYLNDFRLMLKINGSTPDALTLPIRGQYDDNSYNYTSFVVLGDEKVYSFGSFKSAYLFSAMNYLNSVILYEDDIIKDIAENVDVFFGQILIKDKKIIFRDLVSVVNKGYFGFVNDELLFE
jgi:hypothetical protein